MVENSTEICKYGLYLTRMRCAQDKTVLEYNKIRSDQKGIFQRVGIPA